MSNFIIFLLLLHLHPFNTSFYCPYQHRHLGRNILRLQGADGAGHSHHHHQDNVTKNVVDPVVLPQPSFWKTDIKRNETDEPRLICPSGCVCKSSNNDIKVVCPGHYEDHFPLDGLPRNTSILSISPSNTQLHNRLTLSPSLRILRNLSHLHITHSNIPNIGKRTLYGLSQLRSLNLSHNSISHVIDANFDGLSSLSSLSLRHNNIRSITSAAFHHLTSLEQLFLDHNNIKELAPRIFYKLDKLKTLDLSHNNLLLVDEEILKDIRSIQSLSCNSCGLTNFRVGFSLRFLRQLQLADNNIESLDDVEPHILRSLVKLDLSGNKISRVDKLDFLQVEELNLSHNRLERLAGCSLCSSTKLSHLDLGHNALLHLGQLFGDDQFPSLRHLSLAHNMIQVQEIRETLARLPRLESLDLSEMNIVSLPDSMFSDNPHLKHLNLSHNYLVNIDNSIISSSVINNLHSLDISHNMFMGMQQDFFEAVDGSGGLEMVWLQGNPWVCDQCHIPHLRHWLRSALMYWGACHHSGSGAPCLRCVSPSYLNHTPVSDLVILPDCGHINPDFSSMTSTITQLSIHLSIFIVVIILIMITMVIVSKYRHYGVYKTGEEDDKEESILTDPIHVLDRESYVNLRYPTLTKD